MKNIPKTAHLCWFGRQPMPMLNVFTLTTFHRLNPDWKIKVYTNDQEFASRQWVPPYKGDDHFHLVREMPYVEVIDIYLKDYGCPVNGHFVVATDIFRQEILLREGGLYSDFDVLWLRPMSEIASMDCIGDPLDFQCSVTYYKWTRGHHNVSNILAEKDSDFLRFTINRAREKKPPYTHQACGTDLFNELFPSLDYLTGKFERILAFRYETFFPYSIFTLEDLYLHDKPGMAYAENVMCVHWFGAHPLAHEYTCSDGYSKPCSMTSVLKREGLI